MTASDDRFIDLYERFYTPVYAYCRRRTSADRVEDAVAETFLVAWRKIDQVPRGSEVLAWLYGVAYRVLSHDHRGSARRRKLGKKLNSIGWTETEVVEEVIIVREETRSLLEALESLSQTDREILLLSAWEELPQADIAVALNISIGAVRQRIYEAKNRLANNYDRLEGKHRSRSARKGGRR